MAKGLNRTVLARTALAIVDAEGLAALSMRRLASELGVDPMAAYKHVPHKDALLDAVVDAVLADADLSDLPGEGFARLRAGTHRLLAAMTAHPHATPLLAARPWLTPAGLAIIEWGLATLRDAGVDERRAVLSMNATGLFLTGLAQAMGGAATRPPFDPSTLDPARFPATLAALASGRAAFTYPELLDFWLDGLQTQL